MTPADLVTEFHLVFGAPLRRKPPARPTAKERDFRLALIEEEFDELVAETMAAASTLDWAKVGKELADLVYVCYGMAATFGLPLDEIIWEVHRSNMSKLGPDGKPILSEDGKVLKGPAYREADVEAVLAA